MNQADLRITMVSIIDVASSALRLKLMLIINRYPTECEGMQEPRRVVQGLHC